VPLEALVNKFSHMRFEPMGHTTNPDIRIAKSVVDYIFRWMGITFLPGYREAHSNSNSGDKPQVPSDEDIASQPRPAAMKVGGQSSPLAPREDSSQGKAPAASNVKSDSKAPAGGTNGHSNGANGHTAPAAKKVDADLLERAGAKLRIDGNGPTAMSDQFARFQLDAPSCDNCGAITVRNGNCYLCHNCGNSMGCS
jgi:ribonucleoside-diphosphate reductase alpha chain